MTYINYISVEAENVEESVAVHLVRVQTVDHQHWTVSPETPGHVVVHPVIVHEFVRRRLQEKDFTFATKIQTNENRLKQTSKGARKSKRDISDTKGLSLLTAKTFLTDPNYFI